MFRAYGNNGLKNPESKFFLRIHLIFINAKFIFPGISGENPDLYTQTRAAVQQRAVRNI